jgi:hypothetical protein
MGPNSGGPTRASLSAVKGNKGVRCSMAWWRRHSSIQRWPMTKGGWGSRVGASRRRVVPDFGVRRGSAHQSRAAHGVGGRVGKLDGDSAACRSMAAVDKP